MTPGGHINEVEHTARQNLDTVNFSLSLSAIGAGLCQGGAVFASLPLNPSVCLRLGSAR